MCELTNVVPLQSTQNQKLLTYAKYMYDALGQRLRVRELIAYGNQTTFYDALLIYREVRRSLKQSVHLDLDLCWFNFYF